MQKPHPPIGVAGVSKGSDTLKLAGERGFLPMSLNLNPTYVASHWESVEEGARRTGRTPQRSQWRLVREIFVADTDEEAWRLSVGGMMGRMMREYFLPLLTNVGVIQFLKHDPAVADSDVTPEYCAQAQLADRLARDGRREDRADVRHGRRLWRPPAVLLRLQREPASLAPLDGIIGARGHAQGRAFVTRLRRRRKALCFSALRGVVGRKSAAYSAAQVFSTFHIRKRAGNSTMPLMLLRNAVLLTNWPVGI